ncbi:hypothetical protein LO772_31800 [Yinghuangia sp. ASG 101]|uniref:hypothetical protein n=1 Tax=Yinghuangia sp. ASG 101 TaxID=2896848 RepID=UPI001E446208|nr:hypothetical protein [Yinghuangia sp. ASG 101]UGQ11331.1 hypothetical protein LO772_31800 [Yinghuangia sp. ASG 101]
MYDSFDYAAHRVMGSADEAVGWVDRSSLPEEDKAALRGFVKRFPRLSFYRDDDVLLDHLELRNVVVLPPWLRKVRQVLSGPGPDVQVRFDGFDHWNPRADHSAGEIGDVIDLWYEDNFFGYLQDEERDLLRNGAECYPVLCATTGVNYILGANLGDPDDGRIVDLCDEDVMDDCHDGRPGIESVFPAFESYASMLSHVIECRTGDGAVIRARDRS